MRNTLSMLSRPSVVPTPPQPANQPVIPSIRLISATPSATGMSSEASTSANLSTDSSWAPAPTPLAARSDSAVAPRKRLVPKKSKLGLLGVGRDKEKDKGKDLSDVIRRVGGGNSASARGFDIYVDPTVDDPDIGEIVMVKKKKSRAGLDGMRWGSGVLGEVTNVPSAPREAPAMLKVKAEEKDKWWSIGRGRKDSKEKTKDAKETKAPLNKHMNHAKSLEPAATVRDPYPRSKTPEPLKLSQESRTRFNSLDSGILLTSPITLSTSNDQALPVRLERRADPEPSPPLTYSRAGTPTAGGLLAPPGSGPGGPNQGSIAIRAMRSVRSLARIGSWAQLRKEDGMEDEGGMNLKEKPKERTLKIKEKVPKDKEKALKEKRKGKEGKDTEKKDVKKKKKKEKVKETVQSQTLRLSSSSFEIGAASPNNKTLGNKKRSILGLGLPSAMTMRLPTVRGGSTASSQMPPPIGNRLSVGSANLVAAGMGRGRAGSTMSIASSLRPLSTTSSMSTSRASSGSSVSTASVRWDEEGLETVKELRRKEKEVKREKAKGETERVKDKKKGEKESRRTSEGRRRTPLAEVFSAVQSRESESPPPHAYPIVTVEAATSDGHCAPDDREPLLEEADEEEREQERDQEMPLATPVKRNRPRPLSEQLLGRSRPKGMYENEDGVLSILDAATNDLAQLINHLDLEATPGTPDMTPLRPSPSLCSISRKPSPGEYDHSPTKREWLALSESPLKKSSRRVDMPSISSLRPYAQSRGNVKPSSGSIPAPTMDMIGLQITPWPTLIQGLSPVKASPLKATVAATPPPLAPAFRLTHRRTMTPAPEPEPSPKFQPLRPAKSKHAMVPLKAPFKPSVLADTPDRQGIGRAPSSLTFGSASSSRAGSKGSVDESISGMSPSPVFKRAHHAPGHARQRSSLVPIDYKEDRGSRGSQNSLDDTSDNTVPIPPEARRVLGMTGTMGGSDVSGYAAPELDASDPDSDIPEELQFILSNQSDDGDTFSYRDTSVAPSPPGSPHRAALPLPSPGPLAIDAPVFRAQLIDDDENHADLDEGENSSEEDTKKSFDFTGELKKLNETGGSDRRSFVEQLENAFRTPAKVDLRYGLGDGLLRVEVPPVPKLPLDLAVDTSQGSSSLESYSSASGIIDMKEPTLLHMNMTTADSLESKSNLDYYPVSRIIDVKEPTLLPGSDSLGSSDETHDIVVESSRSLKASSSTSSRPSDGQLNTAFKFGGRPSARQPQPVPQEEKPTTLSDIIPPPSHVRSLSGSSIIEDDSVLNSIFAKISDIPQPRPRVNSDSSSKRRARENIHYRHSRHSSGMSFTGFDSFEEVRRGFEFNNYRPAFYPPPNTSRRANHGRHDSIFSIASVSSYGRVIHSGSIDPFDYGLPSLRERPSSEDMSMSMSVDDTFSFLGRGPPRRRVESDASSFYFKAPLPSRPVRGHRRRESSMSIASQAPPVSMYNRSFGAHRRNDSSTSASSVAQSYAMYGAGGGRAAWARHRQDSSVDSVMSDFSAMRLGRPGIGDKMFDTIGEHGMPLTAILASPPESTTDHPIGNRSSFDSILDDDRRSSMDDSLFDKTGHRSSMSSDSVFGYDYSRPTQGGLLIPGQYRPLSALSNNSLHSPMREDDTMISMLGGGHVRRRSVSSIIEASPCVRVEKRKHAIIQDVQTYNKDYEGYRDSPNKARIVEKPSIASTSSFTFGGERMIRAQRGLLERQSLEDSCLIAEGEDLTTSLRAAIPVFSRPGPTSRSRSSTCTSSSGGDTPPLSVSDGFSSMSDGSQSSIDLSHVDFVLANATHPMSTATIRNRVRARARGQGHRRRVSQIRASRSSVYETIEEEMSNASSPSRSFGSRKSSPTACQPIYIVEPDTASVHSPSGNSIWDDERGIVALRKYYALRDEAQDTVTESKRQWLDTPFSVFALQSFQPPRHTAGMQALLEHSVQNYGPLPSELRPRRIRSRTQSRPSPYPQGLASKTVLPSPRLKKGSDMSSHRSYGTPVLQQVPVNHNIISAAPSLDALKPFSPLVVDVEPKHEKMLGFAPAARPRVGSTARRTALGWSKRSTGKSSTDHKENVSQGMSMTPGESLRINRPRPRGRPTPTSHQRPIRV